MNGYNQTSFWLFILSGTHSEGEAFQELKDAEHEYELSVPTLRVSMQCQSECQPVSEGTLVFCGHGTQTGATDTFLKSMFFYVFFFV